MTDHPDPETNPLEDMIALVLAEVASGEDPLEDEVRREQQQWRGEARAIIDGLSLDYTRYSVYSPDGKHLETIYCVAGGWTKAGGEW